MNEKKPEPFISLRNVSLRLYNRILFHGARWQIFDDQHWVVAGTNGSGKSSLVKALCGIVPVVRGKIHYHFLEQTVVSKGWEQGRRPGNYIELVAFDTQERLLRQEGPFYQARWNSVGSEDSPTVSEYLSEEWLTRTNPFEVREDHSDPGTSPEKRREVIRLLDIDGLQERKIIQLSSGEMRKVLLGRALLRNPRLLILDNPFTGLDMEYRGRLREILMQLMKGELRVMVVTSNRDEIPPGITHALLVEDHQIAAQGPVDEVLRGVSAHQILEAGQPEAGEFTLPEIPQVEDGACDGPVLVEMHDVAVSYNGAAVLQDIHWTVRKGEHWVLLGPNGSGKTTLLSLILGDNPQAYANDITLFGRRKGSGESIWEIKKRIGYVSPELHAYYPRHVSCLDVVCSGFFDSLGLYRRCSEEQLRLATLWIERLGIKTDGNAAFRDISEGEQRMILLARALVKQPLLLVLDEPCQGLDARNRKRFLQIINGVETFLDTSVIFVTHVLEEIPRIATHLFRLDRGKIREKGHIVREKDFPMHSCPK